MTTSQPFGADITEVAKYHQVPAAFPSEASSLPSALPANVCNRYEAPAPRPYGIYSNGLQPPSTFFPQAQSSIEAQKNVLPCPASTSDPAELGFPISQGYDTTGQTAPPGMKPRVTATLWEDEGSLCFQVEAKGNCVARREDNHMINGTKLLNVAGMTRGRRDGILKLEKIRHIVKIGPMNLKGVWIPFERALDFANQERITDLLYPLFVHNIGALVYHPNNQSRTNAVMAAAERRKQEQNQIRNLRPPIQDSLGPQHTLPPYPSIGRAHISQKHTFPTPPTSASSIMGTSDSGESLGCGSQAKDNWGGNPLNTDRHLENIRTLPKTPDITPPSTPPTIQSPVNLEHENIHRPINRLAPFINEPDTRRKHGIKEIQKVLESSLKLCSESASSSKEPQRKRQKIIHNTNFSLNWDLKRFVKEQCEGGDIRKLSSVIVLTGSAACAQATTIREYLQQNWPVTGTRYLELLQEAFSCTTASLEDWHSSVSITFLSDQKISMKVNGSGEFVIELAQQFAWLATALRTTHTGQVGLCHAVITDITRNSKSTQLQTCTFEINTSMENLQSNESSCWHELFFNPVIACGFPIPRRNDEKGLEVPIHMMTALCGASHAIEYEGGIVIKGFSSMLVPLKRSASGDSIQWHLIRNEDESRLPYWEVDKRCPGRALVDSVDMASLASTRAFLGWWGTTTTHLGTDDANYHNLSWSAIREPQRPATFSGGTLGFQNLGTGEISFSVGPKDGKLHVSRSGPYQRIIKHASNTPVILYDSDEKRSWLVPSSAVIAHIARTRHFREPFFVEEMPVSLISADPRLNVYESAEQTLLINSGTKLASGYLGVGDFFFRDLVLGIWSLLENLMDKDIKKETTADPTIHATLRKSLRGWEFMDLVEERSPIRLKETHLEKSSGGWIDLSQDINAVVLFASGFEDIIKPAEEAELCHKWKRVPKGKDYLTAAVPLLDRLFEQAGSRLTRKHLTSTYLQWHRGPRLFESCPSYAKFECGCDRIQQICHESALAFGKVIPPGPLQEQGAIIFGQANFLGNNSSRLQTKKAQLYSQANIPLLVETKDCQDMLNTGASLRMANNSGDSLLSGGTLAAISTPESSSSTTFETSYYHSLDSAGSATTAPTSGVDTDSENEEPQTPTVPEPLQCTYAYSQRQTTSLKRVRNAQDSLSYEQVHGRQHKQYTEPSRASTHLLDNNTSESDERILEANTFASHSRLSPSHCGKKVISLRGKPTWSGTGMAELAGKSADRPLTSSALLPVHSSSKRRLSRATRAVK
ncbi:hypothetical protein BP6252_11425 [Coleophoma cylindrospora]|uniref:HTH APSES-type domain-containing protein n=1 Tax=Coleophoma cylindrospora TaxID=1849047 RepID=A0A3D8QJJ8_9HELO|nr:hypothetical protein BP6252_11425 [Coleophoma cylindrospora]